MKLKKIYYLLLLITGLGMSAVSCSDDDKNDDPGHGQISVPTAVSSAFAAKYPEVNANVVEWELKGKYYVAEFKTTANMREVEAWFTTDGTWSMTETDNGKDLFLIPTELNVGFNKTEYASWQIDDIQYYEYPDATKNFYLFEVEKPGVPDMALFFDTTGQLTKTVPAHNLTITPDTPL